MLASFSESAALVVAPAATLIELKHSVSTIYIIKKNRLAFWSGRGVLVDRCIWRGGAVGPR